ncbi:hypothetical protein DUNSADRAFT_11368 [Dunaliella salina]|uniref:Ionotropic glutamate receptor C-terminal domain-containing protein n=1 Tax=Dunaliella salina TaxID=3046 RepID=A0ABQ7GDK4_DUNSA|nr:hypothetical protein DUNSADRAFT_11368 [Dunaliella salina]|eukprot:KAF5832687.1 hypothetical protein DUNSADRAFT_11368 [Dunaliella salina]
MAKTGHACLPFLSSLLALLLARASASVVRDWCPTKEAFQRSGNALMALEGKTIKAGASIYPPFSVLNESTGEWSGFDIEVFLEVARRGRFDVEFTRLDSPGQNETWDDVLFTQGREMDIMCTWWGETYVRKNREIAFTYPILEQSLILATPIPERVERSFKEQFWVFLQPFSRDLWLTLLFGNLFTAIVAFILDPHLMLDAWTNAKAERRMSETYYPMSGGMLNWCKYALANVSNFFYQGWVLGTTQDPFKHPRNPWMKMYLMSWTGVLIVVVAAYTAQLTTFLLIDSRPVDSIDSMDEVTDSGLPVCAVDNIPHVSNFFLNSAPSVPVVSIPTVDQAFSGIRSQECAAALAGKSELELMVAKNEKCDMRVVGRAQKVVNGAYPGDTSNCGSFVVHVIGGIVQQIASEGLLDDLWSTYITEPPNCAWGNYQSASKAEQKNKLELKALGGLFVIHAAFASLALVGFLAQKSLRKYEASVDRKNDSFLDGSQHEEEEAWNKVAISSKSMKFSSAQPDGKQLNKGMVSFGRVSTSSKVGDSDCGDSPTGASADRSYSGGGKKFGEMPYNGPDESARQGHPAVPPLALGSGKGKIYPEGQSEPPALPPPEPSPFARGSSQTPLKSSTAQQSSEVSPPKLARHTPVVTSLEFETPSAARRAMQTRLEQRGSAMAPGSPRSGLEASPTVTSSNTMLSSGELMKLQDDLSRANSFSNLAARNSPKHQSSSSGSQELDVGSNSSLGSKEGDNLHPSSMPNPAQHRSTRLGRVSSQDLGGNKLIRVASRSRLSTSSMAGLVPPTELQQQQQQQQQEQLELSAPLFMPRTPAALGLDPVEFLLASNSTEGGAGEAAGQDLPPAMPPAQPPLTDKAAAISSASQASDPAPHVVEQQMLLVSEEDADMVKPFKLEDDERESHAK